MAKRRVCGTRFVLCGMTVLLLACPSGAFPIHSLVDWQNALASGQVRPVPGPVFQDMMSAPQWPPEYQTAAFYTPELRVEMHEDSLGNNQPALIMRWGDLAQPPPDGTRLAAAWDLAPPQPLDLTQGDNRLEFSVHAPAPCMFVSLNLLDGQQNYREWIWHVGLEPGEIPPCQWTTVWVDPVTLGSNFRTVVPAFTVGQQFDLSDIEWIRFDENGVWSPEYRDLNGTGLVWNAWDHVQTTPEPLTLLSLLAAGGGLVGYLRRRK